MNFRGWNRVETEEEEKQAFCCLQVTKFDESSRHVPYFSHTVINPFGPFHHTAILVTPKAYRLIESFPEFWNRIFLWISLNLPECLFFPTN